MPIFYLFIYLIIFTVCGSFRWMLGFYPPLWLVVVLWLVGWLHVSCSTFFVCVCVCPFSLSLDVRFSALCLWHSCMTMGRGFSLFSKVTFSGLWLRASCLFCALVRAVDDDVGLLPSPFYWLLLSFIHKSNMWAAFFPLPTYNWNIIWDFFFIFLFFLL